MSIKVGQAFERTSAQPIDTSLALTKADMLAVNDNLMPAYYFTICQDDGAIYLYSKANAPTVTTGKFKKFEGGSGGADIHSTTATLNDEINGTKTVLAADLPGTSISDLTVGSSIIKDDKGTLGLVTAINGTTDVTVTTATTSTPVKELTQAEYDALPQADKDNGTIYFITDGKFPTTVLSSHDAIYTETERVVGSYLGKPLYQRTVTGLTVVSTDTDGVVKTGTVASGTAYDATSWNIDRIAELKGTIRLQSTGSVNSINALDYGPTAGDPLGESILFLDGNSKIFYSKNSIQRYSGREIVFTVQYTKTTDTTSPVGYATPNDYSTSEKIVGTWIDGKAIYQKTLHLTASELVDGTIIHTLTATGECVGSEINRAIRTDDGIVHPYSVVGGTNIWQSGVFITSSDTTRTISVYNRGTIPAKEAWITIRYTK